MSIWACEICGANPLGNNGKDRRPIYKNCPISMSGPYRCFEHLEDAYKDQYVIDFEETWKKLDE